MTPDPTLPIAVPSARGMNINASVPTLRERWCARSSRVGPNTTRETPCRRKGRFSYLRVMIDIVTIIKRVSPNYFTQNNVVVIFCFNPPPPPLHNVMPQGCLVMNSYLLQQLLKKAFLATNKSTTQGKLDISSIVLGN